MCNENYIYKFIDGDSLVLTPIGDNKIYTRKFHKEQITTEKIREIFKLK